MKYFAVLLLVFTGCAHVTPYGHGCRDGVKDLEPQLGVIGMAMAEGDALDKYCDIVEKNHSDKATNR